MSYDRRDLFVCLISEVAYAYNMLPIPFLFFFHLKPKETPFIQRKGFFPKNKTRIPFHLGDSLYLFR